jgi:hypothetical protein
LFHLLDRFSKLAQHFGSSTRRRLHHDEHADICVGTGKPDLFHGGIEMFELAATPQRRFKGLTLLVDRDGMEIDVRQSDSSRCRPSGHACREQQ